MVLSSLSLNTKYLKNYALRIECLHSKGESNINQVPLPHVEYSDMQKRTLKLY